MYHCLLCGGLLLGEEPHEDVSLLIWFERTGDDTVVTWGQLVSATHLPQVDEGRRFSHRCVVLEEAHIQRVMVSTLQLVNIDNKFDNIRMQKIHIRNKNLFRINYNVITTLLQQC